MRNALLWSLGILWLHAAGALAQQYVISTVAGGVSPASASKGAGAPIGGPPWYHSGWNRQRLLHKRQFSLSAQQRWLSRDLPGTELLETAEAGSAILGSCYEIA